ncbi:MAG TPA: DUF2911 domain-containing protein [Gemmatimonadales bacterium]|nr:DUF2911 domain-containing protein [Gemmatimonadales bacterium]
MLTVPILFAMLAAQPVPPPTAVPGCPVMNAERLPLASRKSPLDSISFMVGGREVKVCYGRPSARGRTMIGGDAVPYGKIWRTGANEPTTIHADGPITIAGVTVPAGSYSLYTIPGEREWTVIVNRSTSQWGHESQYTKDIEAREAGRGKAAAERTNEHVEQFTIRAEPSGPGATLVLEWETTRVRIPVAPGR